MVLLQLNIGIASEDVSQPVLGIEADGLVVILDGPLVLPSGGVGYASAVVGGRLGVESDCLVVFSNGLFEAPIQLERATGFEVSLRCNGIDWCDRGRRG